LSVVVGVAIVAAAVKALKTFARRSRRSELSERLHGRRDSVHDRLAAMPVLGGGLGGGDERLGQSGAVVLPSSMNQSFVAEQMVAEGGAELASVR